MMPAGSEDQMRHLRAGFDQAAEDYQRTRPVCPPRLFDDLIRLARLEAEDRVVEIGCGTGQATVPLAERGLAITAVELGPELAAVARRRLTGFPAAKVVTGSFEDWTAPAAPFDAVVAVNCLQITRTGRSNRGIASAAPAQARELTRDVTGARCLPARDRETVPSSQQKGHRHDRTLARARRAAHVLGPAARRG